MINSNLMPLVVIDGVIDGSLDNVDPTRRYIIFQCQEELTKQVTGLQSIIEAAMEF